MEEIINNISKLTLEKNINTKRPKKLIIKIKKVYLKIIKIILIMI